MANRHKAQCRASGGRTVYSGSGSKVVAEAKSNANYRGGGKVEGSKGKSRVKKARGGSCDQSPFSSAHRG